MRILIIEDDLDVRDFLKAGLEEKCHTVDTTADGERGAFLAKSHPYDVIILDYALPNKDGLKICKEVRSAGVATPIVMLTIRSALKNKVDALNAGADDYLTKPFSFEELLARINSISRRGQIISQSTLAVGELVLDQNRQKVTRNEKEIHLTRKEFSLLEYLMQNSEEIVSRGMILEHVWNKEGDPFSNTVETHILNLRKKIEFRRRRRLIHNIPGRGYKISIKNK